MEKDIGFKMKFTLEKSAAELWSYFIESEKLKTWLGFSEVTAEVGGDFIVCSRLPFLSGRHKIASIETEKQLSIDWYVEGVQGRIDVSLSDVAEDAKKCEIHLNGVIPKENVSDDLKFEALAGYSLSFFGGSWQHAIFNLKQIVEGEGPGVELDIHKNNGHVVHLEVEIDSNKESLWKLLTTAEELKKMSPDFHAAGTRVELKKGGVYSYGWYPEDTAEEDMNDGPSKVLDFVENERLLTNWHSHTERQESIEWKMEDLENGKIKLTMIHKDILETSQGNVWSYRSGWTAELYVIKWFLERGETESDWWEAKYQA